MKPTNKQVVPVLPALPPELVSYIAQFLLHDDVVDYLSFRAACREWQSSTASPRGLDSCFRPRRWIMLPDGDGYRYTASPRQFLNLSTGRSLLLHLPELNSHYLVSDSDGLLVLVDKVTNIVRLFNPFTRHLADLPPSPPYRYRDVPTFDPKFPISLMIPSCISSISSSICPTVVFFSTGADTGYYAKPGDSCWVYLETKGYCDAMLYFKDRFYLASPYEGIRTIEIEQNLITPLILPFPQHDRLHDSYYLAEYNAEMLVVYQKTKHGSTLRQPMDQTFSVFKVDLESNRLVPLNNVGDLSVFLAFCGRTLVLSSKSLRSLKGNSIYSCAHHQNDPVIILYNFDGGEPESISNNALCENNRRIRSSIRPFTLAHHLITYCKAIHWSFGVMHHEFLNLPIGWLLGSEMVDDFKTNYNLI